MADLPGSRGVVPTDGRRVLGRARARLRGLGGEGLTEEVESPCGGPPNLSQPDPGPRRAVVVFFGSRLACALAAGTDGPTGNDPSAGSPTETLLRLLLPLDSQV